MNGIQKNTIRMLLPILTIVTMLFVVTAHICQAKDKKCAIQYSKDFKKYPDGSPEAVLTAFVEADLENTDDRFLRLTEFGTIPDDSYPKLFINSYKISAKTCDKKTGDVLLDLEMDVRVIWPKENIRKIIIQQKAKTIYVDSIKYSSDSTQFLEAVFNDTDMSNNEKYYYSMPTNRRKWVFPVRMVNKQGKWLLATDTIPYKSCYLIAEIDWHAKYMLESIAMNDVCRGKRKFDPKIIQRKLNTVREKIGNDIRKFKAEYCTPEVLSGRNLSIREDMQIIQQLEAAAEE
jgi:hypothetical protein